MVIIFKSGARIHIHTKYIHIYAHTQWLRKQPQIVKIKILQDLCNKVWIIFNLSTIILHEIFYNKKYQEFFLGFHQGLHSQMHFESNQKMNFHFICDSYKWVCYYYLHIKVIAILFFCVHFTFLYSLLKQWNGGSTSLLEVIELRDFPSSWKKQGL